MRHYSSLLRTRPTIISFKSIQRKRNGQSFDRPFNYLNKQTGFFTARDFNLSSAVSTRIYGIKLFKQGAIRGIRHVLTPAVRFSYRPDFGRGIFNYYYNSFVDKNYTNQRLSYFEGALLGLPPDGKVAGVGFDLGNT